MEKLKFIVICKTKRLIGDAVAVLAVASGCFSVDAWGTSPFDGLAGPALLAAVREYATPRTMVTEYGGESGRLAVLVDAESRGDGRVANRFSGETFAEPKNNALPDGVVITDIVPTSWWRGEYPDHVPYDLNNMVFASSDVPSLKSDYPPGAVEKTTYTNGVWSVGTHSFSGIDTNVYSPPVGSEGDFARVHMYMAVVYPQEWWTDARAAMVMADGSTAVLTAYGRSIFLAWNEQDPVDECERARAEVIAAAQGSANPFVLYPELADYLWGDKSGEQFVDSAPNEEDTPADPDESLTPLKATYSIASDKTLDLYNPYISGTVTWTVDGVETTAQRVSLAELGVGRHELRFDGDVKGGVYIYVEP